MADGRMPRYTSDASANPSIRPDELPCCIGVRLEGNTAIKPEGVAYPARAVLRGLGSKPEQAWRLVVGGEELDGRWALRSGVFVELAEGAE